MMRRRAFIGAGVALGGSAALGGSLWRAAASTDGALFDSFVPPVPGPYGALAAGADENGLLLPPGFTSRIIARSGEAVAGTGHVWHDAPDGGACFGLGSGWIYVSNAELDDGAGGVSAIRFDSTGTITAAYPILTGTWRNCAGGATPWGTWLSCEEIKRGYVYESYPVGGVPGIRRPAMGRFRHEAAAVDPVRRCVYLTEDEDDGCFYRFVPAAYPSLAVGRLDVLCGEDGPAGPLTWKPVPDPYAEDTETRQQVPEAKQFDGGEGCVYGADQVWFTTKGDNRVWRVDAAANTFNLSYDEGLFDGEVPLLGVDNVTRSVTGDLFVAEDGGRMEVAMISPDGAVTSFLRVDGHEDSEITGPAFSPDGTRLYFSSQRGATDEDSDGVTYEVIGPFRTA